MAAGAPLFYLLRTLSSAMDVLHCWIQYRPNSPSSRSRRVSWSSWAIRCGIGQAGTARGCLIQLCVTRNEHTPRSGDVSKDELRSTGNRHVSCEQCLLLVVCSEKSPRVIYQQHASFHEMPSARRPSAIWTNEKSKARHRRTSTFCTTWSYPQIGIFVIRYTPYEQAKT